MPFFSSGSELGSSVDGSEIIIGSDAHGDVLFRGSSVYERLPAGNAGEFLESQGSAADPQWTAVKQVKAATANWTTAFSTSSTTFVDITNATVDIASLSASKTFTLFASASLGGNSHISTNTAINSYQMVLNSVDGAEVNHRYLGTNPSESREAIGGLIACETGVTGSTSYTAKIEMKVSSGTGTTNSNTLKNVIYIRADEE